MSEKYLGIVPIKREGGIYSDEPEYQALINEIYKLKDRIACLEAPLCIGETTIRILAKKGAKVFENGQGLVAADELFKQDPYDRIAELEAFRKKELDFYLLDKKRLSRRIALLQFWMKKLFKYCSSPDAKRNHFTMMTEIPDYLMREGENILIEITPELENSKE